MLVDQTLDCRNINCPMPLIKTKKAVETMSSGQILKVICTDQASKADMPAFARKTGHELVETDETDGTYIFFFKIK